MLIPTIHEKSLMKPEPKLDYIECAFGINAKVTSPFTHKKIA